MQLRAYRRPHALASGHTDTRTEDGPQKSRPLMSVLKTTGLFVLTAIAEIIGCHLPYVWPKKNGSPWLLLPTCASLALFAWLLTPDSVGSRLRRRVNGRHGNHSAERLALMER
jgi:Uncharacterised BCR, YnfA/UPF0060 family